jgi:hypothetical protein
MSASGVVPRARVFAAHGTFLDLVRCEHRHRLERADGPVRATHQAARPVGAPQML